MSDIKTNVSNYDLFSDSEKSKSRLYYNRLMNEEVGIEPPIRLVGRYEPVDNVMVTMVPNGDLMIPDRPERDETHTGVVNNNFGEPIPRIIQIPTLLDIERIGNRVRTLRDQVQDSINDVTQNEKFIDLP